MVFATKKAGLTYACFKSVKKKTILVQLNVFLRNACFMSVSNFIQTLKGLPVCYSDLYWSGLKSPLCYSQLVYLFSFSWLVLFAQRMKM